MSHVRILCNSRVEHERSSTNTVLRNLIIIEYIMSDAEYVVCRACTLAQHKRG